MIKTKKWYRWALISDLIVKNDNTPEENIIIANKYLAFIHDKPQKKSVEIMSINNINYPLRLIV